jgi:DNA-binding CsgD family transcriptional regulator
MRDALADGAALVGPAAAASGIGQLALVLAERGALADAQTLLEQHALEGDVPEQMVLNTLLHARAVVRLAQRRFAEAAADARELGRRHARWDIRRPSPNWRAIAAEALRAGGDPGAATELAEDSLTLARAWGTPKAIAIALRAHALVSPPEAARVELEEAVAMLRETPWQLETARVQIELGAHLRRAGTRRKAREQLAEGMDRAHRCGARGLADRAADELRATGARPRRHAQTGRDSLTASERRVAALAVSGHSNRAIAQELFITIATVETHLRRVYRKLGVDGRAGLATALAGSR